MAFHFVIIMTPFCKPCDEQVLQYFICCINFMLKLAPVVHQYSATVLVFACTLDLEPLKLHLLLYLSSQLK